MVFFLTAILTAPAAPVPKHRQPPFTIVGYWKVNGWTLQFRQDGTYMSREDISMMKPCPPIYHGRWAIQGDELVIDDLAAQTFEEGQFVHLAKHRSKFTPTKDGLLAHFAWGNGQWKRTKSP